MPLDVFDNIDIIFDIGMVLAAYIIYKTAKNINFKLSVISDKAIETNKRLLESVASCDGRTLEALNHSMELLDAHISKVDELVLDFLKREQEIVEERHKLLEKQDKIMDRQIVVLEKQEAIREIVKVIKDEIIESKDVTNMRKKYTEK